MNPCLKIKNVELADKGSETECRVSLCYPRNPGHITHLEVDLEDVRAADSLRVSYDFDRDGWKIEQAQFFSWESGDKVCDPGWIEVAFIQAWAKQVKREDD